MWLWFFFRFVSDFRSRARGPWFVFRPRLRLLIPILQVVPLCCSSITPFAFGGIALTAVVHERKPS